jgi:WD40 repeat protein
MPPSLDCGMLLKTPANARATEGFSATLRTMGPFDLPTMVGWLRRCALWLHRCCHQAQESKEESIGSMILICAPFLSQMSQFCCEYFDSNGLVATGNHQSIELTKRQQLLGSVSALLPLRSKTFHPFNHHFPINNMSAEKIKSAKFQGHQAPVLSLAVSQHDSLLLSGSEDHTARLWDLRDNNRRRASLCIQTSGEVLSVVFAPKQEEESSKLSNLFARDHSMYVFFV